MDDHINQIEFPSFEITESQGEKAYETSNNSDSTEKKSLGENVQDHQYIDSNKEGQYRSTKERIKMKCEEKKQKLQMMRLEDISQSSYQQQQQQQSQVQNDSYSLSRLSKKEIQKMKNRQSAQASRDKAKIQKQNMIAKINHLQSRLDQSELEKQQLRFELKRIQNESACIICKNNLFSQIETEAPHSQPYIRQSRNENANLMGQQQQEDFFTIQDELFENQGQMQSQNFDPSQFLVGSESEYLIPNSMDDQSSQLDSNFEPIIDSNSSPLKRHKPRLNSNTPKFLGLMLVLCLILIGQQDILYSFSPNTQTSHSNNHQSYVQKYQTRYPTYESNNKPKQAEGVIQYMKYEAYKKQQDFLNQFENPTTSQSHQQHDNQQSEQQSFELFSNVDITQDENNCHDHLIPKSDIYSTYPTNFQYQDHDQEIVEGKPLKQLKIMMDNQRLKTFHLRDPHNLTSQELDNSEESDKLYEINCLVTGIKELKLQDYLDKFSNQH